MAARAAAVDTTAVSAAVARPAVVMAASERPVRKSADHQPHLMSRGRHTHVGLSEWPGCSPAIQRSREIFAGKVGDSISNWQAAVASKS